VLDVVRQDVFARDDADDLLAAIDDGKWRTPISLNKR